MEGNVKNDLLIGDEDRDPLQIEKRVSFVPISENRTPLHVQPFVEQKKNNGSTFNDTQEKKSVKKETSKERRDRFKKDLLMNGFNAYKIPSIYPNLPKIKDLQPDRLDRNPRFYNNADLKETSKNLNKILSDPSILFKSEYITNEEILFDVTILAGGEDINFSITVKEIRNTVKDKEKEITEKDKEKETNEKEKEITEKDKEIDDEGKENTVEEKEKPKPKQSLVLCIHKEGDIYNYLRMTNIIRRKLPHLNIAKSDALSYATVWNAPHNCKMDGCKYSISGKVIVQIIEGLCGDKEKFDRASLSKELAGFAACPTVLLYLLRLEKFYGVVFSLLNDDDPQVYRYGLFITHELLKAQAIPANEFNAVERSVRKIEEYNANEKNTILIMTKKILGKLHP